MYYTELVAKIIYWIVIVPFCTSMMLFAAVLILVGVPYSVYWLLERLSNKIHVDIEFAALLILLMLYGSIVVVAICVILYYWHSPVILWSVLMSEDYIVFTVAGALVLCVISRTIAELRRKKRESVEDTLEQIQATLVDIRKRVKSDIRKRVKSQEQIQETLADIQETLVDIRGSVKSQETTFSFYRL
jgi:hypothetical protein